MSRRNSHRRRGNRQPVVHVHNHNTASASARSKSDACVVWVAVILSGLGSLAAACVFVPGLTPVVAGTAAAYAAHMIRQA